MENQSAYAVVRVLCGRRVASMHACLENRAMADTQGREGAVENKTDDAYIYIYIYIYIYNRHAEIVLHLPLLFAKL